MDTFQGRCQYFWALTNPLQLWTSDKDIADARRMLVAYETWCIYTDASFASGDKDAPPCLFDDEELWAALRVQQVNAPRSVVERSPRVFIAPLTYC